MLTMCRNFLVTKLACINNFQCDHHIKVQLSSCVVVCALLNPKSEKSTLLCTCLKCFSPSWLLNKYCHSFLCQFCNQNEQPRSLSLLLNAYSFTKCPTLSQVFAALNSLLLPNSNHQAVLENCAANQLLDARHHLFLVTIHPLLALKPATCIIVIFILVPYGFNLWWHQNDS